MPHALAISHVAFEDLGTLHLALRERGSSIVSVDASTARFESLDVVTPDLVVVLGGPIGVYETESYPFLHAEIELVGRRLNAGRPTLGICLGAQIMARALGARVYSGARGREIGWERVTSAPDMSADPALARLLSEAPIMFHLHGDTFDLPTGARLLASSENYANQAFAFGDHALGLQFHPEVSAEGLERWYVGHACELAGAKIDIAHLRKESRTHAPRLEQAASRFWRSWLDRIGL